MSRRKGIHEIDRYVAKYLANQKYQVDDSRLKFFNLENSLSNTFKNFPNFLKGLLLKNVKALNIREKIINNCSIKEIFELFFDETRVSMYVQQTTQQKLIVYSQLIKP